MARAVRRGNRGDLLLKSAELIGWALGGVEREIAQTRERLATLNAQAARLRARLGRGKAAAAPSQTGPQPEGGGRAKRRGHLSAEARRRISEGMKKRWAERRKNAQG